MIAGYGTVASNKLTDDGDGGDGGDNDGDGDGDDDGDDGGDGDGMVTVIVRCRKPPTLESQTEETSLLPTRDLFDETQLG